MNVPETGNLFCRRKALNNQGLCQVWYCIGRSIWYNTHCDTFGQLRSTHVAIPAQFPPPTHIALPPQSPSPPVNQYVLPKSLRLISECWPPAKYRFVSANSFGVVVMATVSQFIILSRLNQLEWWSWRQSATFSYCPAPFFQIGGHGDSQRICLPCLTPLFQSVPIVGSQRVCGITRRE